MAHTPVNIATLLLASALACAARPSEGERGYLHVILDRLPQCGYGIGFEQPLRIELVHDGEVVATALHSGIYLGDESLRVSLYAPDVPEGRYTIRIGRCPSLLGDLRAAVDCEDVEIAKELRRRLSPAGLGNPQVVEYYRLRARCLPSNPPPTDET